MNQKTKRELELLTNEFLDYRNLLNEVDYSRLRYLQVRFTHAAGTQGFREGTIFGAFLVLVFAALVYLAVTV